MSDLEWVIFWAVWMAVAVAIVTTHALRRRLARPRPDYARIAELEVALGLSEGLPRAASPVDSILRSVYGASGGYVAMRKDGTLYHVYTDGRVVAIRER